MIKPITTTGVMSTEEQNALRTRITDLRRINDQLLYHRLPQVQEVVNSLHVISITQQHQQLTSSLSSSTSDGIELEQQVREAQRQSEDVKYRYNNAEQRLRATNQQFEEYQTRIGTLSTELSQYQKTLTETMESYRELCEKKVQSDNHASKLETTQRQLNHQHATIQGEVTTLSSQLSDATDKYHKNTELYHNNITTLQNTINHFETDINSLQELIKKISNEILARKGELANLEEEIKNLSTKEQRCEELELVRLTNQNTLNQLKQTESTISNELKGSTNKRQQLDLDCQRAKLDNETKSGNIQLLKDELDRLDVTIQTNNNTITELKLRVSELTSIYHQAISSLTDKNQLLQLQLQETLNVIKNEVYTIQSGYDQAHDSKKQEYDRVILSLTNTIAVSQSKCDNLDQTKDEIQKQLTENSLKINQLRKDVENYQNQQQNQSNTFQQRFLELQQTSAKLDAEEEFLKQQKLAQITKRREFDLQNEEFISQDCYRRKLHNILQDLKGNIRVLCRIRPQLNGEVITAPSPLQHLHGSNDLRIQVKDKEHSYNFETIFGQNSTQQDVFTEVQEVVQSAIDGYEVCLFSYGQTGSGKSHTMTGSLTNDESKGIIPRSVDLIFDNINDLQQHNSNWEIKVHVSCIQIYLDRISDLLSSEKVNLQQDLKLSNDQVNQKITIHGLNKRPVTTTQDVYKALECAQKSRVVAATSMNATSSRSHFVFTLHIEMKNDELNEYRCGALNLCDLAGSERVNSTKATGKQLDEATKINQSLSTLNRVFMQLADNSCHIAFRETRLTELLQYCLSGEGKTLMIVNLSPIYESAHETNTSLQLAQTVATVQRGSRNSAGQNRSKPPTLASAGLAPTISGLNASNVRPTQGGVIRKAVGGNPQLQSTTPMSQTASTRSFASTTSRANSNLRRG
jgi:kinesin family protein C1